MNRRNKGIVVTSAAVLLCGCPGLIMCAFGALAAAGSPLTTELDGGTGNPPMDPTSAIAILLTGVIFLIIPILVGLITLRRKSPLRGPSNPPPPAA